MSKPTFQESGAPLLTSFPRMLYYAQLRLMAWHPAGVLDDDALNRSADFVEAEEASSPVPFNRYVDLDGVTEMRIRFGDTVDFTDRRRASYAGPPVRAAIFCSRPVGFGVGRMYSTLMTGSAIQAQAFQDRGEAAAWLGVPLEALCPTAECFNAQQRPF
jgi:hypothetical protein